MERLPIQAGNWDQLLHFLGVVHRADGLLEIGSGDNLQSTVANATTGQSIQVLKGTLASPDTTLQPVMQINRVLTATQANLDTVSGTTGTPGQDNLCALKVSVESDVNCDGAATAVTAFARTRSTTASPTNDAVALQGWAVCNASATGAAMGLSSNAYRYSTTGSASGAQVFVGVRSPATTSAYNSTGFTTDSGISIFLDTLDTSTAGAGIVIMPNSASGAQFEVGIGFPAVANGAVTGVVKNSTIRDDSHSATSLDIRGAHATAAISVDSGAGPVIVGGRTAGTVELLYLKNTGTVDPIMRVGDIGVNASHSTYFHNTSGVAKLLMANFTDAFGFVGMVAGDFAISAATTGKKIHIGGISLSVIAVKADNTLSFFNTATVAQQGASAEATTSAAGSTTSVFTTTTFTGGSGSSAYSIGGIVKALKAYGLLAA